MGALRRSEQSRVYGAMSDPMQSALVQVARTVQRALRVAGLDVRRHDPRSAVDPVAALLAQYGVDCVFDVGANNGSTGRNLRRMGYRGRIVSFEPVSRFHPQLRAAAEADPAWQVELYALGDAEGELDIHVAGGVGGASSFLESTPLVQKEASDQPVIAAERVRIRRLDSVVDALYPVGNRLFVKMDVQGFEPRVLAGAAGAMTRIVGLQLELSIRPAYEGEVLLPEMLSRVMELGYSLCWVHPTFRSVTTGEVFQVDGYFFDTKRA